MENAGGSTHLDSKFQSHSATQLLRLIPYIVYKHIFSLFVVLGGDMDGSLDSTGEGLSAVCSVVSHSMRGVQRS